MPKTPTKQFLAPAHYEAIGQVVVSCSALQHVLSIGAFSLAVNDGRPWEHDIGVSVLTTGMSAQTLIGICRTLAKIRAPKDADAFDELADEIQKTFKQRDIFAHCIYKPGKKPGTVIPQLAKTVGSLRKTQDVTYSADDIKAWADVAAGQIVSVLAFLFRWDIGPDSLLERQTEPAPVSHTRPRRPDRRKRDLAPKRRKPPRPPRPSRT